MLMIQEQYVVDTKGKKLSVILSLERYEQLLEDLYDLAVVAERRDEQPISFQKMKRRLTREQIYPVDTLKEKWTTPRSKKS